MSDQKLSSIAYLTERINIVAMYPHQRKSFYQRLAHLQEKSSKNGVASVSYTPVEETDKEAIWAAYYPEIL